MTRDDGKICTKGKEKVMKRDEKKKNEGIGERGLEAKKKKSSQENVAKERSQIFHDKHFNMLR